MNALPEFNNNPAFIVDNAAKQNFIVTIFVSLSFLKDHS